MRAFDFSSWQALLSTVFGLALITLVGVGIRLVVMQTIQQRRARENRQINERLRTLIAAYRTLGGSFTGNLAVDPRHLRDLRRSVAADSAAMPAAADGELPPLAAEFTEEPPGHERNRRIRDAVEAALSDIILLGTEEQVRLAATAASELVAGRHVHTSELVVSLRNFIREVLDLDAVPREVSIPNQGPTRPASSARGRGEGGREGGARQGGGGGAGGGGGGGGGGGAGAGLMLGGSTALSGDTERDR